MNSYKRREPCGNCPFRKDAPLAYWDPREYLMLAANERSQGSADASSPFGCHKDRTRRREQREHCVGWLIHQRENGVPSLSLRLRLVCGEHASAALEQFAEARLPEGVELYDSVTELVAANLKRDRELHPERYEHDEDEDDEA